MSVAPDSASVTAWHGYAVQGEAPTIEEKGIVKFRKTRKVRILNVEEPSKKATVQPFSEMD